MGMVCSLMQSEGWAMTDSTRETDVAEVIVDKDNNIEYIGCVRDNDTIKL